jgi:hypothetical protein
VRSPSRTAEKWVHVPTGMPGPGPTPRPPGGSESAIGHRVVKAENPFGQTPRLFIPTRGVVGHGRFGERTVPWPALFAEHRSHAMGVVNGGWCRGEVFPASGEQMFLWYERVWRKTRHNISSGLS